MVKEIVAKLKLDGKEFKTSTEEAKAVALGLSGAITAMSAAVAVAVKTTATYEDSLTKLSRSAGLTVQSMSELAHAADLSGIEHGKLAKNMKKLLAPGEEARKEFTRLGISLQSNEGKYKTQDQLLNDIADKFKAMKSPIEMAQSATEIFGGKGTQMVNMLKDGSAGLQAMRDEAVAMGIAFSQEAGENAEKLNDDLSKVGKSIQGVTMSVSNSIIAFVNQSGILDMVAKAVQKVTALWNGLDDSTKDAIVTVGAIIAGIAGVITVVAGLSAVLPVIMAFVGALSLVSVGVIAGVAAVAIFAMTTIKYWDQLKGSVQPAIDVMKEFWDTITDMASSIGNIFTGFAERLGITGLVDKFNEWRKSIFDTGDEISILGTIAGVVLKAIATAVVISIAPWRALLDTIQLVGNAIYGVYELQQAAKYGGDKGLMEAAKTYWQTLKSDAVKVYDGIAEVKTKIEKIWEGPLGITKAAEQTKKAIEEMKAGVSDKGEFKEFFAGIYKDFKEYADLIKNSAAFEKAMDAQVKTIEGAMKNATDAQKSVYQKQLENLKAQANSYSIAIAEKMAQIVGKVTQIAGSITGAIGGLVQNFNVGIQRSMEETSRSMQIAQIKYTEQMQATIEATQKAEEEKAAALEAQYDKQIEDLKNAEERKLGIIENASAERLLALNNEYLEAKRMQEEAFAAYLEQEYARFEAEKALLDEKSVDKEQRQLAGQVMDEDWRLYEEVLQAEQQAKLEALQKEFTTKQKSVDDKAKADKVATSATTKAQLELLEKQKSEALQKLEAEKNAKLEALEAQKLATEKQMKKDEAAMKWKAESAMLENMKPIKVAETMTQAIGSAAMAFGSMAYLGPVGIGIGAAIAAMIMANAAYSVSNILSQKAPKPIELSLGTGGVISGPSHAQGGVAATVEGGEGVIDRARTEKLLDAVDSASTAGRGGVSIIFEAGSIQNSGKDLDDSFMDQLSYAIARRMERMGYA